MPEKYFICQECGDLQTETEILDETSNGGPGNCDCRYIEYQWNPQGQCFEPVHSREYVDYVEIPEAIYNRLTIEDNEVLRLRMYRSWKVKHDRQ